ncbi:glutamate-rich protein 5 isoform X1 [Dipodomys merriami]|uniref:glutamate-rich protein 5 isoform X1 n=1 Tax=Dipodomys merriami TaxID=94247 RepID=UPI003855AF61
MGCSSSALTKAGDSSRVRSGEESDSCVAQPKPCAVGRESMFRGRIQRESRPPLEKPKASVVPTANGVQSHYEQPLTKEVTPEKDTTEQLGPTEQSQPLEGQEDSGPSQLAGKDDAPGAEEKTSHVEAPPLKANAECEPLGTEAEDQPLRTARERDSPGAGETPENPQTAGILKLETAENVLETAGELQSQAMEKDEQSQLPETITKENNSPEIVEKSELLETVEDQTLPETSGKDEQLQGLGIPKENETLAISNGSHLVQTPVMNESLPKTPEGSRSMEKILPEGIIGILEHPEGDSETAANVEMAREIHTNAEEECVEGETGEKVETEMENEKASRRAETKEEETEAVDLSAAP